MCVAINARAESAGQASLEAAAPVFPGLAENSLGALSIGHPHEGYLMNGVRMPEGKYWTVTLPQYAYGTEETIDSLIRCITLVNQRYPDSPKVLIGSISKEFGGYFPPHKSHQSGRDADVSFYYNEGYSPLKAATRESLDVERTWALLRAFVTETDTDMILIDQSVQHLLEMHALRRGEDPAWLKSLFHGNGTPFSSLIKHVPGHTAHMHVRFSSPIARRRGAAAYLTLVRQGHIRLKQHEVKHLVKRGDTLLGIARVYKTHVQEIVALNRLESTKIRVGQTLLIKKPEHLRGALEPIFVPKRRLPAQPTPVKREASLRADPEPATKP